jgi:hypothetical protein
MVYKELTPQSGVLQYYYGINLLGSAVAEQACQPAAPLNRRLSLLITPREHGAWGLLFVPLAIGGAIGLLSGGSRVPLLALAVAAPFSG